MRKTELFDLLTPFAVELGQELKQAIDTNFSNVLRALDQLAEKIDTDRKLREDQNSLKTI
ncbi:hypothetical protein SDC49_24550 [Lactobacillus sp. R2/2]|nr:hypothetical protein [Lactobacillus sp. R2/2]